MEFGKRMIIIENRIVGVGEDKISNLPDEIIHRILYRLPSKCSMSTCILSKRWHYIVNSIPIVNFFTWRLVTKRRRAKKILQEEAHKFMNFLSLLLQDQTTIVQKFSLTLDEFIDRCRFNKWICCLIKRRLEELLLKIDGYSDIPVFPLLFFTCDTLTQLDLRYNQMNGSRGKIIIPSTVCFLKLKIIRLDYIAFVNAGSTSRLFSNCPVLEELTLDECAVKERVFSIVNPAVKKLVLRCWNVFPRFTFNICTPNLETLNYLGQPDKEFVVEAFTSVVGAKINLCQVIGRSIVSTPIFESFSNVKVLKVSDDFFLMYPMPEKLEEIVLTSSPVFNNLIHVEVFGLRFDVLYLKAIMIFSRFFRFLQMAPNHEFIIFLEGICIPVVVPDDDESGFLPKFPLPQLKHMQIGEFLGGKKRLNAVKVLMENACSLENLTIVASELLSKKPVQQVNVMEKILMFPKPLQCVVKMLVD